MSDRTKLTKLSSALRAVVGEVHAALPTDAWALTRTPGGVVAAYSGAGLAHCCALATETLDAHARGAEMTGRLLARAGFEAWLTTYYVTLGGTNALERVAANYLHAVQTQQREIERHDRDLLAERKAVQAFNRRAERDNKGISLTNLNRSPDEQIQFRAFRPEPVGVEIGIELRVPEPALLGVSPRALSFAEIISALRSLTKDAGSEETFEVAYHLAYRGLSNLGSHPSLFVLDAYLDDRKGQGNYIRVTRDAVVPSSFELPNVHMTLLLVCSLTQHVFERRGTECPLADAGFALAERLAAPSC